VTVDTTRIVIDRSLCSGFGSCVELAPRVFALDAGGTAEIRAGETDEETAKAAVAACPMGAIGVLPAGEAALGEAA
jgi:ferredoxin